MIAPQPPPVKDFRPKTFPAPDGSRTLGRYSKCMETLLTTREAEIAWLVAAGKSNRAIAAELSLSRRTVENHLYAIYSKLGIRGRVDLAIAVYRSAA